MHTPAGEAVEPGAETLTFDFETTFRQEYANIARVVVRILGDPSRAEELTVEAFWRLWRHQAAHGPTAGGWLRTTAVRLAIDELRQRSRRERYTRWLPGLMRTPRTPDDELSTADEQRRVRTVLAAMSAKRAALLLLSGDEASYRDLANTLSMNPASVGTELRRARAAFEREYVRRYGTPS